MNTIAPRDMLILERNAATRAPLAEWLGTEADCGALRVALEARMPGYRISVAFADGEIVATATPRAAIYAADALTVTYRPQQLRARALIADHLGICLLRRIGVLP